MTVSIPSNNISNLSGASDVFTSTLCWTLLYDTSTILVCYSFISAMICVLCSASFVGSFIALFRCTVTVNLSMDIIVCVLFSSNVTVSNIVDITSNVLCDLSAALLEASEPSMLNQSAALAVYQRRCVVQCKISACIGRIVNFVLVTGLFHPSGSFCWHKKTYR